MRYLTLLAFVLAGCHDIAGLDRAVPYDNPAFLRPLWAELEQCSGLRGSFDAVSFATTPMLVTDGADTYGIWLPDFGELAGFSRIIVVDRLKDDPRIWRHEMMHALLMGGSDHPPHYFNGVCGPLP